MGMKIILTTLVLSLLSTAAVQAKEPSSNWIVDIGDAISHTAHLCTLKNGGTMQDIERIDKKLNGFLDAQDIKGFRQILTPLFAAGAKYDYIAFDFMAWDEFGKEWDLWLGSKKGAAIAAEYAAIEDCDAIVSAAFPLMRKPEIADDDSRIVTVEWCTRKEGVTQDQLAAKHQQVAKANADRTTAGWWGVGYPQAGVRDNLFPGDFYHLVNYSDMKAFAAAKNSIANNNGWRARAEYYFKFADCTGEHTFTAETVRNSR